MLLELAVSESVKDQVCKDVPSVSVICDPGAGMGRMDGGVGPGLGTDLTGLGKW